MSETNIIEVKMYGIEVKGTVKQIAELKKLLDEQNQAKYPIIHWTYPPYYTYQPFITSATTTSRVDCANTTYQNSLNTIQGITSSNGVTHENTTTSNTGNATHTVHIKFDNQNLN